jgi:hypothetical protein
MYIGHPIKYPLSLSDFNETCIFWEGSLSIKIQISNFMKIHQVGAELFHVDRWTDMAKLTVAFCNFLNMPKMIKA